MDDTNSLAVREWAERRDDALARAFAEGLSDDDVLAISEREHFDLSPEAIAEKRGELYERTVAIVSTEGPRILRRVRHMNPAYRMTVVENWMLKVSKGVNWAADTDHWSLVPKLVDAGLKGMRYMREETNGIRHTGDVEDRHRTERLSRLTPEARIKLQEHMTAAQEILDSGLAEPEVVVGEFTVEDANEQNPESENADG